MKDIFEMRTRTRIRGLSMRTLGLSGFACAGLAATATTSTLVVMAVTRELFENPWVAGLAGLMAASLAVGYVAMRLMDKQKLREFAAGYTTSRMGYSNMEQVDERTGLIVRAAGEPLLTRQEHRARVHAFEATMADS